MDTPRAPHPALARVALAAIVALYLALSLYQLNLPGLHYDEAFEAVPAMQLVYGQPVTAFRNSGLRLGGQLFPLMTQDYIGALNLYGAMPFVALLGPTPVALRLMSVLTGVITLLLTAALAQRLSGARAVGLLAALLLAADPTFIFWNRQGVFVTAVTAAIGVGAAWCWLRRLQGGSLRWSAAGAFLFGLGLYAKFLFLWLIAALVGAALLLNLGWPARHRAELTPRLRRLLWPEAVVAALAFVAGCWPLLLYNLQTGGTFISISENAGTSYYGVDNLAFVANLATRLGQFSTLLDGGHLWYLGGLFNNWLAPALFGLMSLAVALLALRPQQPHSAKPPTPRQAALFPLLVIGLVLLASIATVSALWITHFALLMPWPALALALGGWFILRHYPAETDQLAEIRGDAPRPATRRAASWLVWAALVALVGSNLLTTLRYHQALAESGGLSFHSDAVYDLSDWLEQNAGERLVVAMDWGLAAPVVYLSGGRVNAVEAFGYQWQPDAALSGRLAGFIAQPGTLYLWRTPEEVIFDRSDEFKALYRPQGLEETIEEAFYERSGRPLLGVTRLVPQGTAENPPN
ncbi:MAG: hypothetical protein Kow0031_24940 [Anaerolineae bacterium]